MIIENFSVLISVYNKEKPEYLIDSLMSLINQSLIANEIVIVKDGKLNKKLIKIILNFKNEYKGDVVIVGYEDNKGLGFALNFGLKKCSNEIIFRMDSDDIADTKRFEKQINYLVKNEDISIVGSFIKEFISSPGDLNQIRKVPSSCVDIMSSKKIRNPFNHMTVAFKKTVVEEVGGYKDMPGYEDYYLWLRLLKKYKGFNLTENLVYARIGNDMIGKRQGIRFFLNEINFQKTILSEKLISPSNFILNIFLRAIPRLIPKFLLKKLYKTFLRN